MNDIRYIDRSKGSSVWGGIVKGLGAAAAIYTGETSYMDLGNSTGDMVASYKGFKVNAARKSKVDDNTARMQSIKQLGV